MRSPMCVTCLLWLTGCGEPGTLNWHVAFESDALRARADVVVADLLEDGCEGKVAGSYIGRADGTIESEPPADIRTGTWALRARALDRFCVQYAEVCTPVSIHNESQSVEIELTAVSTETATCPLEECFDGECRTMGGADTTDGDWLLETVSDTERTGDGAPALAVDDDGGIHVFWEDGTRFLYSVRMGTDWTTETLTNDVGVNPSVALEHFDGDLHFAFTLSGGAAQYASFAVGAPEDWVPVDLGFQTFNVALALAPAGEPVVTGCVIANAAVRTLVGGEWIASDFTVPSGTTREVCVAAVTEDHFYLGITESIGDGLFLADRERSGDGDWHVQTLAEGLPEEWRVAAARLSPTGALIAHGDSDHGTLVRVDTDSLSFAPFDAEREIGKLAVEIDGHGKPVVAFVTPEEGIFFANGKGLELVAAGDFTGVSLALDSSDAPHIAFYSEGHLTYARQGP